MKKSRVEEIKEASQYLRGTLKESLAQDTAHFSSDEIQLIKFHGFYQQDDRDQRPGLLKEKKEKAYSMMVRVRMPGGFMGAEQYLAYDEISDLYGNASIRLTTRQGIQFHGILKKNIKTVIQKIHQKLGTTSGACGDVVRNVMSGPPVFDENNSVQILDYAKSLSDHFLCQGEAYYELFLGGEKIPPPENSTDSEPEPLYGKTYLPRKFKIAIAFPEENSVDVYSNDLGIVPEVIDGKLTGFNILVGGGFGMTHNIKTTYPRLATQLCFVKPGELLDIAEAVVRVQKDYGNRSDRKNARLKYLLDARGMEWFRAEVEKRFGRKTEAPHPVQIKGIDNYLGWRKDGKKWAYGLFVENGRIKDQGAVKLKTAIKQLVSDYQTDIYVTPNQDILLSGIEEEQKKEIEDLLILNGVCLSEKVVSTKRFAMACPAMPTCGLAISESERVFPGLTQGIHEKLEEMGLEGQKVIIRMTGCPNGCARPYNAELAFVGKTTGTYNIYVGGNQIGDRLNFEVAEKVAYTDLVERTAVLLAFFKDGRLDGEAFGDFCHRAGIHKLTKILNKGQS